MFMKKCLKMKNKFKKDSINFFPFSPVVLINDAWQKVELRKNLFLNLLEFRF